MAADWIKMRSDLQTHPKIVRILSATKSDKFRVIGGLHAVWVVFDTHSVDGVLNGYTPETMDHIIGWSGFSEAMIAVGWLTFDGCESLAMPEFEAHNGQSAKRRAEDQKRKKQSRNCPQTVRKLSANSTDENRDKKRTREEKRREDSNNPLSPPSGGKKKATSLPSDWSLPDTWRQEAKRIAGEIGATPNIALEADKFRDYWHGVGGARGRKVDWLATWRNWIRTACERNRPAVVEDDPMRGAL